MSITLLVGDCMDRLRELPDESAHCCVTSPPYWGLRDYGTSTWEGGDPKCDHKPPPEGGKSGNKGAVQVHVGRFPICLSCGAKRINNGIGLEETLAEHVDRLVAVFREVWRVLRKDGTFWLNYGDAYAGSWGAQGRTGQMADRSVISARQISEHPKRTRTGSRSRHGLKPKDRMLLPARVAIALQDDGWWLRDEIIWHKPNPMPLSVRDRTTPAVSAGKPVKGAYLKQDELGKRTYTGFNERYKNGTQPETRNRRSVWTISTKPFKGAHFATFPPDLIEPCILAGAPESGTVIDPFAGAGTTGLVARDLGRKATLIEISPTYADIIRRRLGIDQHAELEDLIA